MLLETENESYKHEMSSSDMVVTVKTVRCNRYIDIMIKVVSSHSNNFTY
jgi:hypothetical protein